MLPNLPQDAGGTEVAVLLLLCRFPDMNTKQLAYVVKRDVSRVRQVIRKYSVWIDNNVAGACSSQRNECELLAV